MFKFNRRFRSKDGGNSDGNNSPESSIKPGQLSTGDRQLVFMGADHKKYHEGQSDQHGSSEADKSRKSMELTEPKGLTPNEMASKERLESFLQRETSFIRKDLDENNIIHQVIESYYDARDNTSSLCQQGLQDNIVKIILKEKSSEEFASKFKNLEDMLSIQHALCMSKGEKLENCRGLQESENLAYKDLALAYKDLTKTITDYYKQISKLKVEVEQELRKLIPQIHLENTSQIPSNNIAEYIKSYIKENIEEILLNDNIDPTYKENTIVVTGRSEGIPLDTATLNGGGSLTRAQKFGQTSEHIQLYPKGSVVSQKLVEFLHTNDIEPEIGKYTIKLIIGIGDQTILPDLVSLLSNEKINKEVQNRAAIAIKYLGNQSIMPDLVDLIRKNQVGVSETAISLVSELGDRNIIPTLNDIANDRQTSISMRLRIAHAISRIKRSSEPDSEDDSEEDDSD